MKINRDMIIAGLATVGGLAIISKTPVMRKRAETVVFNAREFPKKVRLSDYLKLPSTPICKFFLDAQGDYFNYGGSPRLSWNAININFEYDKIYKYMFKEFTNEQADMHQDEWFYYFNKIHNIPLVNLNADLEFWYFDFTPAEQQQILNNPINYNLVSKQEFENIWNDNNNSQNIDRIDAYWELYTNGTIDSKMNDEPSPLYQNARKIFGKLAEATFDNLKPKNKDEQEIYDDNMEKMNKAITISGWEFMDENFNYRYGDKFYGLPQPYYDGLEDNKYNLSNDEIFLLSEWFILRYYIMYYGYWNTNIKPLLERGFDVDKGVIVENIRGTWDAYNDKSDKPSRYNRAVKLSRTDYLEKHLFSESFITKQFLKKRPKFLQLNNKILNLEKNKEAIEKEQDAKEAILTIREIVSDKNKLGEHDGYYDISNEIDGDEDYYRNLYKEDLNNNIEKLIIRAGDKMTDADRRMLKQRWKEYLEQIKYQKIQENKEIIENLEKANDRMEAFIKDYEDEIDKMDLKG